MYREVISLLKYEVLQVHSNVLKQVFFFSFFVAEAPGADDYGEEEDSD